MSSDPAMDRLLRDHLASHSNTEVDAARMSEALTRAMAYRQRPSLFVAMRGASMTAGSRLGPEVGPRSIAVMVALALLLALGIALAIVAGGPKPPSIRGIGLLALGRNGDIVFADPSGQAEVTVVHSDGLAFSDPVWSPTGQALVFRERGGQWHLLDTGSLKTRLLGAYDGVAWSPDGSMLAVGEQGVVRLVDATTGVAHDLAHFEGASTPSSIVWSPDGRWIAAAVNGDLLRLDAEAGDAVVLVSKGDFAFGGSGPAWSPDGSTIAFNHFDCSKGRPCAKALAVISFDGSGLTVLTDYAPASPDPAWSSDGSWIAYASPPMGELTSPDGLANVTTFGLSVIRPDGSGGRLVADRVGTRAWTPDGMRLTYSIVGEFQESSSPLWAFDPATGRTEELGSSADSFAWQPVPPAAPAPTLPPAVIPSTAPSQAALAPSTPRPADPADPSASAFGIGFDTGCTVVAYEFASSKLRPIADEPHCPPFSSSTATWASDGSAIAVGLDHYSTVIGRDGTILLDTDAGIENFSQSWSPGGKYLLEQVYGDLPSWAIIRPDGSGRTTVPGPPVWSPDDSRLAVRGADGQLLAGAGDGSDLAPIGNFPAPSGWSPDSRMLVFVRNGNAWLVGADGTSARPVTTFERGGVTEASWSPDGRWIGISQGTAVWVVAPDGSGLQRMNVPDGYKYPRHVWSPDGSRIAVPAWPARDGYYPTGSMPTFIVAVADGSATIIDHAEDLGPIWSPDGRFLAVLNTRNIESEDAIDVMNADGSGRHTIWSGESGAGQAKAWLP